MNIIFLDIDGVLNDWERSWRDIPQYNPEILPRCVQALNKITLATKAKLVLSSSWRGWIVNGSMTLAGFEKMLHTHGVRAWLVGHTRMADDEYRWQEIAAWLKDNKDKCSRYCILDDDHDAFGGRPGVQTAGGKGLTDEDANEAIGILTN